MNYKEITPPPINPLVRKSLMTQIREMTAKLEQKYNRPYRMPIEKESLNPFNL
jgi:hypothetical protein